MAQTPDSSARSQPGKVFLIGAGPGDPGYITVRGLEVLRRADVVVFDALANPRLLSEAPAGAELIDAGKRAKDHKLTQDQTNQLLADKAKETRRDGCGKLVARLKGGDPYLFGRGAEEAAFLARQGVEVEIVPGVTSGIAAPGAAGIPVTHRSIASTVTFVTGHEKPGKDESSINYAALAALIDAGGTACFYMGVGRLADIRDELLAGGLEAGTPAALVQWGTTPRQKSVRSTLRRVVEDVQRAGISSPAIIVVGQVAAIDEPGLDAFTRRPLFGQRILITRTRQQASQLGDQLAELGADVLEAPTIDVVPASAADLQRVDAALQDIQRYDWLVLTSANGVIGLAQRLEALGLDSRAFAGLKIAVIGEGTQVALRERLGIAADFVPTRYVAESLAGELIASQDVKGKSFLLLRADIARPALPKLLAEAGANIEDLAIYETALAQSLPDAVLAALRAGEVDWITFTSASTARNMAQLLGDEKPLLANVKIASIGPITSDAVRELGLNVALEAPTSTMPGLVDAIRRSVAGLREESNDRRRL